MRTLALRAIALSALGVGAAYGSAFLPGGAPRWGIWLFIVSMAVLLVSMIALGAIREGTRADRGVLAALVGILALLIAGFGAALVLPADAAGATLWFGLPRRAAIVLYGIGVLPLFALPLVYAFTFDRLTLTPEDIERVRAAQRSVD
jgi:hypothetical protein